MLVIPVNDLQVTYVFSHGGAIFRKFQRNYLLRALRLCEAICADNRMGLMVGSECRHCCNGVDCLDQIVLRVCEAIQWPASTSSGGMTMNAITDIGDRVALNNETTMPWLGLGVFQMSDEEARQAALSALETGYRSIDTAAVYRNEAGVGQALRDTSVPREHIFLTTKLWNEDQRQKRPLEAFKESLERLQTDYVDLYLIHWPVKGHFVESWKAMEEIYASGRAKAIGVSNFLVHQLQDLMSSCEVVPAVNQVEFHPYLVQPELLKFCGEKNIVVEAWSPLMQGAVVKDDTIAGLAGKYGKSPAQIVLRWDLQHGVVTIPKSVRPERIAENAGIFDFEISAEDMALLDGLDATKRFGPDPDTFSF